MQKNKKNGRSSHDFPPPYAYSCEKQERKSLEGSAQSQAMICYALKKIYGTFVVYKKKQEYFVFSVLGANNDLMIT